MLAAATAASLALAPAAAPVSTARGVASTETGPLAIKVLSNRADLISGGDALVQIVLPAGTKQAEVRVGVDGKDVKGHFAQRPDGRYLGLLQGLKNGKNVLTARLGTSAARITITNYPTGGPIFAGAQVQPWFCTTADNGLGQAVDSQCNAPTKITYKYRSSVTRQFADYNPSAPPPDVATTTTDTGLTVPYIVRVERGTADRGIYEIAVLADPAQSWKPWKPQPTWNHKLLLPFGQSTAPHHRQTPPTTTLDDSALSRGFMVANNSLNIQGKNANNVVNAEAVVMLKERIEEQYGAIRYTIGQGCSGGSIGQHVVASTYPGLLDGLLPNCSYPDTWTTANEVADCALLLRYWNTTSPQLWAALPQRALVSGHMSPSSCHAWVNVFAFDQAFNPSQTNSVTDCGVPADQRYNAQTNPGGVRCDLQDYQVAVWGRRAEDGFAKRPTDNVGIQYGLNALNDGLITPEQFLDLNEKIGGFDIDWKWQPARMQADPGSTAIAYRTGAVTDARALADVPIIDLRGTSNNEIHTDFHSHELRARLDKVNGHHENHVIWTSEIPLVGGPAWTCGGVTGAGTAPCQPNSPLLVMDEWLSRIEADPTSDPLPKKVRRNKPPEAVDSCWIGDVQVTDMSLCQTAFPYFAVPRVVAGGPFTHDTMKCRLKPLDPNDYSVAFTAELWTRLKAAFAGGVCDWTRQSVDVRSTVPWLTFAGGPGGQPLGPAPVSQPVAN